MKRARAFARSAAAYLLGLRTLAGAAGRGTTGLTLPLELP